MKTKKMLLTALLLAVGVINLQSQQIQVMNLDDGNFVSPQSGKPVIGMEGAKDLPPINSFNVAGKEEGVRISSLCSSASRSLIQSRRNVMAGLAGQSVPTDRRNNPSAWYTIPENGWQLWDGVQTSFNSFMGSTIVTNPVTVGEVGHRIVISASGRYPVSDYWCWASAGTNYGTIFFQVGMNSGTNTEIAFNANFIGVDLGTNGIFESSVDLTTGIPTRGGDDILFSNGEFPSAVQYHWWYRFGATLTMGITNVAGFSPLKTEFTNCVPELTVGLIRLNAEVSRTVALRTVKASQVKSLITRNGTNQVRLKISGGQTLLHYLIQTTEDLNTPIVVWDLLNNGYRYHPEEEFDLPSTGFQKYFRYISVP